MVLIGLSGNIHGKPKKASVKTWTISKFSSKWHIVDFLLHHLCGLSRWWIMLPGENHWSKIHGGTRGQHQAISNPIPVCPLRYVASGPQFRLGRGNEGSRALYSPNCQNILEFHVGTLASWLPVASGARRLVLQRGVRKSRGQDTAWHLSWWSLSSMDWDVRPGRALTEQRGRRAVNVNSPFRGLQQQLSSCASFDLSHENCFLEYRHT